jgi:hypothetical protein
MGVEQIGLVGEGNQQACHEVGYRLEVLEVATKNGVDLGVEQEFEEEVGELAVGD